MKSGDANQKYLGRQGATNKGANIEIFRGDLPFIKKVLDRENRIGFTANLYLPSAAQIRVQEAWAARCRGEEEE
jgi:hypothetical protein